MSCASTLGKALILVHDVAICVTGLKTLSAQLHVEHFLSITCALNRILWHWVMITSSCCEPKNDVSRFSRPLPHINAWRVIRRKGYYRGSLPHLYVVGKCLLEQKKLLWVAFLFRKAASPGSHSCVRHKVDLRQRALALLQGWGRDVVWVVGHSRPDTFSPEKFHG